jgi:RNA polymerase sigma-70 factor (ECF subfamily)
MRPLSLIPGAAAEQPTPLTLEGVYRQHFDFVVRKATRLGGPEVDPEDAAHEVFLVVARRLASYDGTSLVTTWLYGITANVVRSMRRRARVRRLFEGRRDPTDLPPVRSLDRAEVVEARRIAYEILNKLSAKKRETFILAELEGHTCEEIAQLTGTRTETVWSRLHYARAEFARRLQSRRERGR